jgi:hypothetical protein
LAYVAELLPGRQGHRTAQIDIRGTVVRCVRLVAAPGPSWVIEQAIPVSMVFGGRIYLGDLLSIGDCYLRPIRAADGEDEMLRIAGRPEEQAVPA